MVWALLAVVTGLALFALAAGIVVLVARRRVIQQPNTFRCRTRVASGWEHALSTGWSRTIRYGFWAHDVLVLRHGVGLLRTQLLPVSYARGSVRQPRELAEPSRLGLRVLALTFVLDDGTTIEAAVPAPARDLLAGPFLLAALDEHRPGAGSRNGDHGA